MRILVLAAVLLCAALPIAGCGGGSGGTGTSAPEGGAGGGGAENGGSGGAAKRATAPNAPAGSRVVACGAGAAGAMALRATALDCGTARRVARRWAGNHACGLAPGASRGSCALGKFRCQAVGSDRGAVVSCAREGGDVTFLVEDGS